MITINRVISFGAALGVAAALIPVSTTVSASEAKCKVPFSFTIGDRTLPPGTYDLSTTSNAVLIRGEKDSAFVLGNPIDTARGPMGKLVFLKTGDRYQLAQVWMPNGIARDVPRSHTNVEPAVTSIAQPERVVVLLK